MLFGGVPVIILPRWLSPGTTSVSVAFWPSLTFRQLTMSVSSIVSSVIYVYRYSVFCMCIDLCSRLKRMTDGAVSGASFRYRPTGSGNRSKCHGFWRCRFLTAPASGNRQNMLCFLTSCRCETWSVIGPYCLLTGAIAAVNKFANITCKCSRWLAGSRISGSIRKMLRGLEGIN